MGVNVSPLTWALRALWLTLPLTVGDLVTAALADRSDAVGVTVVVLAWAVWAGGLLASLVVLPPALTALRILAPLPLAAAALGAVEVTPSGAGWLGLAAAAVVVVLALSAEVGADFIDGASYGDERRFGLRPPGALLLGPVQLTWLLTVAPLLVGLPLLAARSWLVGGALTALGLATAWWGVGVLHRLSRRCLVFVPAGLTLVDELTVVDPILFRRRDVGRLGPAPADSNALDLSGAAPGLILQIDVDPPVPVLPTVGRRRETQVAAVDSMLVAPSRPGALLRHAGTRDLAVQRS